MTAARVLALLQAGMIMSWLYACVSFMTFVLVGQSLPFTYALACFILAAIITHFSSGRPLRNYLVLVLHLAGFAAVLAVSVHHVFYASQSPFSPVWMRAVYGPHAKREWAELILLACSVLAYWIAGRSLARARMTYHDVCTRLDIGLAAFFALFLLELAITEGSGITGSSAIYSLFSFLLLGILSVGASFAPKGGSRRYSSHHRVAGAVATFSASVVLTAISAMLFFLPAFERAAHFGFSILGSTSRFAVAGLLHVLELLSRLRRIPPPQSPPAPPGSINHSQAPATWLDRVLWHAAQWGLEAAVVLAIAASILLVVFLVGRWLLRRSGSFDKIARHPSGRRSWWSRLVRFFLSLLSIIRRDPESGAAALYRGLLKWGTRSGFAARVTETPAEFGARLCVCYPDGRGHIDTIVNVFGMETYGGLTPKGTELHSARAGLGALRSPRYWPRRFRSRVLGGKQKAPENGNIAP